jgi:alginate O-acetyltransferase complex protein AlgI
MTFVSFEYLALLAATVALYQLLSGRGRLALLLVASYVFYCYWEPWYGYIIAFTTVVDYAAALAMDRSQDPRRRRLYLWASLAANLGMLGFFKYTNFAIDTLRPLLGRAGLDLPYLHVLLPVGISFYTFQEMSYTLDVYRGRVRATGDLLQFAAYVSFFPQLVAGPIERYPHLMPQLLAPARLDPERLQSGVGLIVVGLFKKLCLADRLTPFVQPVFQQPQAFDGWALLLALVAMPAALYFDFGGYTDIARGSARLLGVDLVINFDYPFTARNPAELWQRWHVSLTSWMRDYVFAWLGGSSRLGATRSVRIPARFLITAALLGLWHGAAWKFVLWGVSNGLALAVYVLWRMKARPARGEGRVLRVAGSVGFRFYTFLSFALFFCPDVPTAASFWGALLTHPWTTVGDPSLTALAVFLLAFLALQFAGRYTAWRARWNALPGWAHGAAFGVLFYAVLFLSVPAGQKFVYMQF